jgi:hypothetical protein
MKPTPEDLDLYLRMLEGKRVELAGTDTSEENTKLLNKMAWQAIIKTYER